MRAKVKLWFHGLFGGAIGGGASSATASLGLAGAQALGIPVQALDMKQLVAVFVSGFITNALLYLKQSPLPPPYTGETQLFTNPNTPTTTSNTNENETK